MPTDTTSGTSTPPSRDSSSRRRWRFQGASPGMLHGRGPPGIGLMLLRESKVIPGRTRDKKQSQPHSAWEGLALRNHPRQARPRQSSRSLKETLTGSLLCTLKSPSGWVYAFLCSPKSCTHRALNKVST